MNLRLCTPRGLTVRLDNGNGAFQRELDLHLHPMSSFDTVTFNLIVLADFILTKDTTSLEHKVFVAVIIHMSRSRLSSFFPFFSS